MFLTKLLQTTAALVLMAKVASPIKCFQCSSTEDQRKPTGVWSEDQYTQNRWGKNCNTNG